jgi:hypothetical protein
MQRKAEAQISKIKAQDKLQGESSKEATPRTLPVADYSSLEL